MLSLLFIGGQAQVRNLSGVDNTVWISQTIYLPPYTYASGKENWDVVAHDFDRDGDVDAVTCSKEDNKINFHLNDGKGELKEKRSFDTGLNPSVGSPRATSITTVGWMWPRLLNRTARSIGT